MSSGGKGDKKGDERGGNRKEQDICLREILKEDLNLREQFAFQSIEELL